MKSLVIASLLVFSTFAFADEPQGSLAEKKAHMVSELDQRITALGELKTCVSSAADEAALKACHEKMHEERKDMRAGNLEHRKEMIQKRIEKMKRK